MNSTVRNYALSGYAFGVLWGLSHAAGKGYFSGGFDGIVAALLVSFTANGLILGFIGLLVGLFQARKMKNSPPEQNHQEES